MHHLTDSCAAHSITPLHSTLALEGTAECKPALCKQTTTPGSQGSKETGPAFHSCMPYPDCMTLFCYSMACNAALDVAPEVFRP